MNKKIEVLVDLVNRTSDDYYRNVTFKNAYSVLVPATNTSTDKMAHIVENAKQPLIILEALAFFVFFAVAFIDALVSDNKKRKNRVAVESEDCDEIIESSPEEVVDAITDQAESDVKSEKADTNNKNKKKNK